VRTQRLELKYKGKAHVGIQLDMWHDPSTHTSHACITVTTVSEPLGEWHDKKTQPQLFLCSEIISFSRFPFGSKTGANISEWFTIELDKVGIKAASISGITPDGAADGQAGLVLAGFGEKVDTCHLHQLQRGLLYCIGVAGAVSKNPEAKKLIRDHNRIVQLTRQSGAMAKAVRDAQAAAGVPEHKLAVTKKGCATRSGGTSQILTRNCMLRVNP